MSLKDILGGIGDAGKKLLGGGIGGGDFVSNLLANALTAKVLGGDTKDALMFTALQQGLGTGGLFGAEKTAQAEQMSGLERAIQSGASAPQGLGQNNAGTKAIQKILTDKAGLAGVTPFKQADNTLGYSKFLIDAGILDPNSKIASLLNSRVGEAGASMLISSLLDKYSADEDVGPEERPFGGGKYRNINMMRELNSGGTAQTFPRRDGGIMPSEGSGTEDDVPAMLTAGEFVLTRDAVKGLGNGNLNQGIQKAYSMMDNLERRA